MKLIISILATFFLVMPLAFSDATVSVSKEQFQSIDLIDKKMREKYASYDGVSGSADNLTVHGITKEGFENELAKIDIDQIRSENIEFEDEKKAVSKQMAEAAIKDLEAKGTVFKHKDKVLKSLEA